MPELHGAVTAETLTLLDAAGELAEAPLTQIAAKLRRFLAPYVRCSALVIFTEDCTGRPQKKDGAEEIISRVSLDELEHVRASLEGLEPAWTAGEVGGRTRPLLALRSLTGALLVLTDPAPVARSRTEVGPVVVRLWHLAAVRIRDKVAEAPASYLRESRAASAERARITAELTDLHSTSLETILTALRSPGQSDAAARASATELAAAALVRLRGSADRTAALLDEPVAKAFERLRTDLRPLERFGGVDVQFVEPPADGRALPGEVAHAARAIVRSLVLAMVEQDSVHRIRVQWDCDGTNLLVNIRDDGKGQLSLAEDGVRRIEERVQALDGRLRMEVMAGWGADVSVALPLDVQRTAAREHTEWGLAAREEEVLQLLGTGMPNRGIAAELHISENTVKFHLRNVFRKLGVSSRAQAIALLGEVQTAT
ncbi:helix-turn-helix transcriptional regulator [Sinomonas cyclohexanicum]|uniref:Helix-turn-helix transcriptional regulator n=1 Tax=Sinomonas cyclohexanicum TaxID=322009 RepID=A0ABN6FCD3_SINCY|nr:LuxR C-terminal-related transcriptional regulator [Corynebacterium cyclohexanicum]BCT74255.1 helix-turn-helix transcriptional regulator [Corynebacterium cyclohexanicum]